MCARRFACFIGDVSVVLLASITITACEGRTALTDPSLNPGQTLNQNAAAAEPVVVNQQNTEAGASPTEYEVWCRHYCDVLDQTDVYCGMAAGYEPEGSLMATCFELRCAPGKVQPSLCYAQCDSLRRAYDAVCEGSTGATETCPASPADHDRACRAGCPAL